MIESIRLQNFRSYDDESFEFKNNVNIVVGPNTCGKTNLLESILIIGTGKTYRSDLSQVIKHQNDWTRIDAWVEGSTRTIKLKNTTPVNKKFEIEGQEYSRLPASAKFPVVLFEPNNLRSLTESPEQRRVFIDDVLEQTVSGFSNVRRQYKRILSQRNNLLKQSFTMDQMFVWNLRLCEFGTIIVNERKKFIEKHNDEFNKIYNTLSSKSSQRESSIEYTTSIKAVDYSAGLLLELDSNLQKDKLRGFTTSGPHREDISVKLDGHPLYGFASRGETRTALLALKLLEMTAIEESTKTKPILLLDDVFGELDGYRRKALTSYLKQHQTFITTTDADVVIGNFLDSCNIIPLG
jgi:DNA replication and repair protein RecF